MQSMAKPLSQDQENDFADVDQLLVNQLRTLMQKAEPCSAVTTSVVISTDLCVSTSTISLISKVPCLTAKKEMLRNSMTD